MKKLSKLLLYLSLPFLGLSMASCSNEPTLIPGSQGTPGVIGPQGSTGEQGEVGDKGPTGLPGTNGIDGVTPHIGENGNWFIGETDTGIKATSTITGDKGEPGVPGKDGNDGTNGANGTNGQDGEAGDKGPTGDQGNKGETGDKGPTGDKGETGVPGDKGPIGDKGEPGNPGLDGEKGPIGNKGETGDKGEQGDPGIKGENGDKGETGAVGEKGPTGEQGEAGIKGETGKSAYQIYQDKYTYAGTEEEWVLDYVANKLGTSKTYNAYYYNDVVVDVTSMFKNTIPDIKYELTGTVVENETKTLNNGESLNGLFNTHSSLNLLNNPGLTYDPSLERAHEDIHAFSNEGYEGFVALVPLKDELNSGTLNNGYDAYAYYVSFKDNKATRLTDEDIDNLSFTFLSGKEVTITHSKGKINFDAATHIMEDVYINSKDPNNNPLKIMDSKMYMLIDDVDAPKIKLSSFEANVNEPIHFSFEYTSIETHQKVTLSEEEALNLTLEIVDAPEGGNFTRVGNDISFNKSGHYRIAFSYGVKGTYWDFYIYNDNQVITSVDMSEINNELNYKTTGYTLYANEKFNYSNVKAINYNGSEMPLYRTTDEVKIIFACSDEGAFEISEFDKEIIFKKTGTFDFYLAVIRVDETIEKIEGTDFVVNVASGEDFHPTVNIVNCNKFLNIDITRNAGSKYYSIPVYEMANPNQESVTFTETIKTNVRYTLNFVADIGYDTINSNIKLTYKGVEVPYVYRGKNDSGFDVLITDTTSPIEFEIIEVYQNETYSTFEEAINIYKSDMGRYVKETNYNIGGIPFVSKLPTTFDKNAIKQVTINRTRITNDQRYITYLLEITFNEGVENNFAFLDYQDALMKANFTKASEWKDSVGFFNESSHEYVKFNCGNMDYGEVKFEIKVVDDNYLPKFLAPYLTAYKGYTKLNGTHDLKTRFDSFYENNPLDPKYTFGGKTSTTGLNLELLKILGISDIYNEKIYLNNSEGMVSSINFFDVDDYAKYKESVLLLMDKCDVYYSDILVTYILFVDPETNTGFLFAPDAIHFGSVEIGIFSDQIIDSLFRLVRKANTSKGE